MSLSLMVTRNASGDHVCVFGEPTLLNDAIVIGSAILLHAFVSMMAVLVNAYTIAAIWPRRHRRATQSTLFVLQLAFADLLCGLSRAIFAILSCSCRLADIAAAHEVACKAPIILSLMAWTLSATTLAAIALDRYVCIVHSLRYYEFMNTRRVLIILGCLWVFSGVCANLYLPSWNYAEGQNCMDITPWWHLFGVQVPLSFVVLVSVTATHLAIRSESRRNDERCRAAGNNLDWVTSSSASIGSAKLTILVVSSFVLCYLPFQVFQIIVFFGYQSESRWGYLAVQSLSSCWYLVNPFLYAWKNAAIREDMVVLWKRLTSKLRLRRGETLTKFGQPKQAHAPRY